MKIKEIITALENEITFLRGSVRCAGNLVGVVCLGEDIGKLETALLLIKRYEENYEIDKK